MSADAPIRRLPTLLLAALGITVVAGIAALLLVAAVTRSNRWVQHAIRTQTAIVELSEHLARFESAYRGYMIRANPGFLTEVAATKAALAPRIAALRRESRGDPDQWRALNEVDLLIQARVREAEQFMPLRLQLPSDRITAMLNASKGRELMVAARQRLTRMYDAEEALLVERQRETQWLTAGLAVGLAAAVLLVVVVALLTIGEARRRYAELAAAHREAHSETTAREAAENQVRQMQKMETLGQLTGGIAHDFNNMLAVVIGSLDTVRREGCRDVPRTLRNVDTAMEGAERAAALVARLLAFARQQPLSPAPVDANVLIEEMTKLLRRTLGETVEVETELAPGLWHCFVDRGQLENALLNLAVNARDAMAPSGGRLLLRTANVPHDPAAPADDPAARDHIMLSVRDTGQGMSPAVMERAVEPFFTTKEVGKGTGLGLSQVFGFVTQSGGQVAMASEQGQGTTIELRLPRRDAPHPAPTVDAARPTIPRGRDGETVLVVEDEPLVRAFSAEALTELGYEVVTATDGVTALRIIASDQPIALLFTDVVMPGMGGEALASAARTQRPTLKLLYTTGYRQDEHPLDPPAAMLPKPFTLSRLANRVRSAIDD